VRAAPFAIVVLLISSCKNSTPQSNPALTHNETWCPDGFESGPSDTCFAIPEPHDANTPILVYLHGMYQGHGNPGEWSAVREATKRGFAVIVPRGKRGLCAWKAELKDHFCWPTEADDPHAFKSIVAEWDRVLWQVDAILEGGAHKRYVLGFSNGGEFAEYLATQGTFAAQAYAVVDGSALAPPPKVSRPPPMLLLSSPAGEAAAKMKELHDALAKTSWTHAWCTRATEQAPSAIEPHDVDAALRFFKRDADGALKAPYVCEGGAKPGP
jgi:poly(3-hydroxybutyrate) depolymerase